MTVENRKPRINIKKLGDWIDANTATAECPFCKESGWSAANGADFVGCAIPFGDGKGDMYMSGFPVLPLICRKCNFVRNIALTPGLLEKILEKDSDDETD